VKPVKIWAAWALIVLTAIVPTPGGEGVKNAGDTAATAAGLIGERRIFEFAIIVLGATGLRVERIIFEVTTMLLTAWVGGIPND
jgi:hypothetical protein